MSTLAERLIRFGLDGDASALERPGVLREQFVARLVRDGWARANVLRLLGEPKDVGVARAEVNADGCASRSPVRQPEPSVAPSEDAGAPFRPATPPPRRHLELVGGIMHHELPRMYPGPGVRHDCVHESECLGRAVRAMAREDRARRDERARRGRSAEPVDDEQVDQGSSVHCPTWCTSLVPVTRERRMADASAQRAPGFFS